MAFLCSCAITDLPRNGGVPTSAPPRRCAERQQCVTTQADGSVTSGTSQMTSVNDPVVERLKQRGLALTRENYLKLAYPDGPPEPLPAELLAQIDEALRDATFAYSRDGLAETKAWQRHRHSAKRSSDRSKVKGRPKKA